MVVSTECIEWVVFAPCLHVTPGMTAVRISIAEGGYVSILVLIHAGFQGLVVDGAEQFGGFFGVIQGGMCLF